MLIFGYTQWAIHFCYDQQSYGDGTSPTAYIYNRITIDACVLEHTNREFRTDVQELEVSELSVLWEERSHIQHRDVKFWADQQFTDVITRVDQY